MRNQAGRAWTSAMDHGTWHPQGQGRLGPVTYRHHLRGQPTGLSFRVTRLRHWWICSLAKTRTWPLIGSFAARHLARMQVKYCGAWLVQAQFRGKV